MTTCIVFYLHLCFKQLVISLELCLDVITKTVIKYMSVRAIQSHSGDIWRSPQGRWEKTRAGQWGEGLLGTEWQRKIKSRKMEEWENMKNGKGLCRLPLGCSKRQRAGCAGEKEKRPWRLRKKSGGDSFFIWVIVWLQCRPTPPTSDSKPSLCFYRATHKRWHVQEQLKHVTIKWKQIQ